MWRFVLTSLAIFYGGCAATVHAAGEGDGTAAAIYFTVGMLVAFAVIVVASCARD